MIQTLAVTVAATTKDLTTLARLKTDLSITGTASDSALSDIIREASDAISTFCARPEGFGRETVVETFRDVRGLDALILSRDLAPAITSVVEDGVTLASTDYLLDGSLLRRLDDDDPDAWCASKVVVTYLAGYTLLTDVPYDLERACLALCATIWSSRGRDSTIRSETVEGVGDVSYLDPRDGAGGLPKAVADSLARYRRVVLA